MAATTSAHEHNAPWYRRWELPTVLPSALLAFMILWSVTQSIATANWAEGLDALVGVALLALLVGSIFARLRWLPGWLAHLLSAALGVAWAFQRVGSLLVNQSAQELGAPLAERLATWNDRASEILIRTVIWARILQAGGRGEDIVLFVVALALLSWSLGYATGWLLFRAGWTWWAVLLNAITILVNYTFASPKPDRLFFLFLGAALLLIVHQTVVRHQRHWQSSSVEYPELMSWRFLVAATLFCSVIVLITGLLPGNVSSLQVARAWRTISSPLTVAREGWEQAFSTIKAPEGVGGGFATGSVRVGGPRVLGDALVMRVRSSRFDYWRAATMDRYTGRGWQSTVGERARAALGVATEVEARSSVEPGTPIPQSDLGARTLVTQTVELAQERNDGLLLFGGQFASAGLPVLTQNGVETGADGRPQPNFSEIAAVFAETPLRQTGAYTVTAYMSTVDEQSLRAAGTNYPDWVRGRYLQLPDTVMPQTRALAQQIVQQANATNPYDQAKAIEEYLRRMTYDVSRPAPPEGRDWVDYFLFTGQRGYCDDFASAMIVMLRSLNIPVRWAQGYAGGSLDPQGNAYVVRESIAHSWPEVYFPGYGWQRFEPTPASYASVPVRPAQGDSSLTNGGFDTGKMPNLPSSLDELRRRELEDLANQRGSAASLEANRRAQAERLARERVRWLVILGGLIAALLAGVGLFFLSLRREVRGLSPARAAYVRLGRLAGWAGWLQEPHVTPYEFADELRRNLPAQRAAVDRIVGAYVAERYSAASKPDMGLEQDWRALRRSLLARMASHIGAAARWRPAVGKPRR